MVSVSVSLNDELKARMDSLRWINWSELAREEISEQEKDAESFEIFKKITAKSKLTEEDALKLAREVNKSLHKRYKELYSELE